MTPQQFIARIAPYAVATKNRTGISAALIIAQAALESAWGGSQLAVRANNLFGVKGRGSAGSVTMPTTEFVNGRPVTVNAAFRAYRNWGESVDDHAALLTGGVSWNPGLYRGAVGVDGRTAARAVAAAGYATDPGYAAKLIGLMDAYNLHQYDSQGEGEDEMAAEDRQRLAALEAELRQLQNALAGLDNSRNVLKNGLTEQGNGIKNALDRLSVLEGKDVMTVPAWAQAAVQAAAAAGILDTPEGGSYDFYRMITVLHRAGLLSSGGA